MSGIKCPPVFCSEEDDDYRRWKSDVEVWQLYTKEDKCRQGPAVYLSLKGKARDAVRGMSKDDLKKDNGFDLILAELDKVFEADNVTRAYCAFKDFVTYRRNNGEGFSTYTVEFEKKHQEIEKYDMNLPTGVLAFLLLQAANLTPYHEKLVRTAARLEYKDMQEKIQKVFGETGAKIVFIQTMVGAEVLDVTLVKEEAIHFVGVRKLNLHPHLIVQTQS